MAHIARVVKGEIRRSPTPEPPRYCPQVTGMARREPDFKREVRAYKAEWLERWRSRRRRL
eukprot:gene2573-5658_t